MDKNDGTVKWNRLMNKNPQTPKHTSQIKFYSEVLDFLKSVVVSNILSDIIHNRMIFLYFNNSRKSDKFQFKISLATESSVL